MVESYPLVAAIGLAAGPLACAHPAATHAATAAVAATPTLMALSSTAATPTPDIAPIAPKSTEAPPEKPVSASFVIWSDDSATLAISYGRRVIVAPFDGPWVALGEASSEIRALAFAHDGATLGAVCDDGSVRLWDVLRGTSVELPRPDATANERIDAAALAFSRDDKRLVARSDRLRVFRVPDRSHVCSADPGWAYEYAFSPDRAALLGTGIGELRRWDAANCKETFTFQAKTGATFGSTLSVDGADMAVADADGHDLSVFATTKPAAQRAKLLSVPSCDAHVGPMRYSRDGRVLVAAGIRGTWFRSFDAKTLAPIASWSAAKGAAFATLDMLDDGLQFVTTDDTGRATLRHARRATEVALDAMGVAGGFVGAPDARHVAASKEAVTYVWDVPGGKLVRTIDPRRGGAPKR